jgi:hypothetical protein
MRTASPQADLSLCALTVFGTSGPLPVVTNDCVVDATLNNQSIKYLTHHTSQRRLRGAMMALKLGVGFIGSAEQFRL